MGGLGIRDMLAFNKALLAKQAWRLMTKSTSLLARVFKAKYYRKTDFMEARSYQSSSYAWRSIIQTQPLIKKGMKWIILMTRPSITGLSDTIRWDLTKSGSYTTNRISNLNKRGRRLNTDCQVCGEGVEDIKHMLLECKVSKEIWSLSLLDKFPEIEQNNASWKSPADKAGIGWSLYSKEGILRLQGSSAIEATTSPLVAEAMAILLAVQQLNCTGYNNVAVLGDSLQLFKCLNHT
ncbi:unnamed protein product, partial [Brassica rapa]